MSVKLHCDYCGKEIVYADDADLIVKVNQAWWDAVEQHQSNKTILVKPDQVKHACGQCSRNHDQFMDIETKTSILEDAFQDLHATPEQDDTLWVACVYCNTMTSNIGGSCDKCLSNSRSDSFDQIAARGKIVYGHRSEPVEYECPYCGRLSPSPIGCGLCSK